MSRAGTLAFALASLLGAAGGVALGQMLAASLL